MYLWDFAHGMEFIRYFWDVAVVLGSEALALDKAARLPLCSTEPMAHLFREAGLDQVETRPIAVPTKVADVDDFW
jgi:hypothetical protein